MKRKFMMFLTLPMVALSLFCCGGGDDEPESKPEQPKPDEPSQPEEPKPEWKLVWEDDFDAPEINYEVWSRIPQGTPDWAKYQSLDDRCYEKRKSSVVLKGIVNDDNDADSRAYLCGGLWTLGKKAFGPGRIEVRARMTSATGAWPAIWMMPFKSELGWPHDGEIDIMEHLNSDRTVYQTLHSKYIDVDGNRNNPLYSRQTSVSNLNDYHIYGVDITEDAVVFHIDGKETLSYPKNDQPDQFPYFKEWDLRIDMQLGGSWVGPIRDVTLPVEMEVDWVRYYEYK